MTWKINWADDARKQLRKLDQTAQKKILEYLREKVAAKGSHPSDFGKPLRHNEYGLWRYRVGDYRVVCQIQNKELLVLKVGHRKSVYHGLKNPG